MLIRGVDVRHAPVIAEDLDGRLQLSQLEHPVGLSQPAPAKPRASSTNDITSGMQIPDRLPPAIRRLSCTCPAFQSALQSLAWPAPGPDPRVDGTGEVAAASPEAFTARR
jgi:hypothetical protein